MAPSRQFRAAALSAALCCLAAWPAATGQPESLHRRLYVASPGIRNYVEFGGIGVLVFDVDHGHRFVKRIPVPQIQQGEVVENVKGIAANALTDRLYVSTIRRLICLDLKSEKVLWSRASEEGCDRMALSPDGKVMYLPTLEKAFWHVIDALTGEVISKVSPDSGSHNTVFGPDGKWCYLAGLRSPLLTISDAEKHRSARVVGPFSAAIRPFTVNGSQTLCFVNVNELLGFEVGDIPTGTKLCRVEVAGFQKGTPKRHGCPSHGIGLTPDETELWLADAANQRMHVFDATVIPPRQKVSLPLREQPGWVTFSIDGRYAYPSTGEVFETSTKKQLTALADEEGRQVHSEKMLEIQLRGSDPIRTGDQFGSGRMERSPALR